MMTLTVCLLIGLGVLAINSTIATRRCGAAGAQDALVGAMAHIAPTVGWRS